MTKTKTALLSISELRLGIHRQLPQPGQLIDMPIGMTANLRDVIAMQDELRAAGYRVSCRGKGNGLILSIRNPQPEARQTYKTAFAT